jgi:hypothetical protein
VEKWSDKDVLGFLLPQPISKPEGIR